MRLLISKGDIVIAFLIAFIVGAVSNQTAGEILHQTAWNIVLLWTINIVLYGVLLLKQRKDGTS